MTKLNFENSRLLDVVDENDRITDSKSRADVHNLGLLHREIQVWLFDENKNVFFQKMGLHKRSAGLLDATVAGHLHKGEEYLAAAVREAKEETGVSLAPSDLIFLKKIKDSDHHQDDLGNTVNNFIRSIFIYKIPIDEKMLKKEAGIPGGGFQKLSYEFLLNVPKEDNQIIKNFVLTKEIPDVLKYLSAWKN